MDIAKIRKKLQQAEADDRHSGKAAGQPETEKVTVPSPEQKQGIPAPPAQSPEPGKGEKETAPVRPGDERQQAVRAEGIQEKPPHPSGPARTGPGEPENILEILTFKLMREDFALRVSELDEIIRFQHITSVPRLPDYVLGITSLRGKIIPVIDLKRKLSFSGTPDEDGYRRKILIIKGPKGRIGAAVDQVTGVVRIAESGLLPPPSHLSDDELRFISGIAVVEKRFVSVLNMQEAISLSIK
ncbi:MAG: chemotaxis protein CheW [Nitrospirota bacterium]